MSQGFSQLIWTQIADGAASTSTSEATIATSTTLPGSGTGSVADGSLASFWYPGKTIEVIATGIVTTASSSQGNLTLTLRLNSTSGASLGASAAIALAASQTNITWALQGWIVCRTIGSSGTLLFTGTVAVSTAATTNVVTPIPASAPATATIDTTANNQIVLDATLGSASDSITVKQWLGKALN